MYMHLEMVMHQGVSFTCTGESIQSVALCASFASQARCVELEISDPNLRCKLYDALVRPVFLRGNTASMPLISATWPASLMGSNPSFLGRFLDVAVPRMTDDKHTYADTDKLPDSISGGNKQYCTIPQRQIRPTLMVEHRPQITRRVRDGGRLCLHACTPWGVPCCMQHTKTPTSSVQPWPRRLRQSS